MEQVVVELPGGGTVRALRLQDLPAEHIIGFLGLPPGAKERMGVQLFELAAGALGTQALSGLTYGELEAVLLKWVEASMDSGSDSEGVDFGAGAGLDWTIPPGMG